MAILSRRTLMRTAQPKSRIPQFKDDPLGAIGIILQEIAAGQRGAAGPVAKIATEEREREAFELRRFQVGLGAVDLRKTCTHGDAYRLNF